MTNFEYRMKPEARKAGAIKYIGHSFWDLGFGIFLEFGIWSWGFLRCAGRLGLICSSWIFAAQLQALPLPSLSEALQSRTDVWGEAALRQTNGPSYEFFEKLGPPLRYVNADFHFYPIVLSAPNSPVKARLIS